MKRPILGNELPDHDVDSDQIWSEMAKPTGRKRPMFWGLFVALAVLFFVVVAIAIVVRIFS